MQNTVPYSNTRLDRFEVVFGSVLAVAALIVVAVCVVSFVQLLGEFERSVTPVYLKLGASTPVVAAELLVRSTSPLLRASPSRPVL